jgi:hypothetical protein
MSNLIGTVIEEDTKEDEKRKFVPEWEQKVTDEQGNWVLLRCCYDVLRNVNVCVYV